MKRWTYRLTLASYGDKPLAEPIIMENRSGGYLRRKAAEQHALAALGSLMEVGYRGTYETVQLVSR